MNFYHALIKYDPVDYPFQDEDRRPAGLSERVMEKTSMLPFLSSLRQKTSM